MKPTPEQVRRHLEDLRDAFERRDFFVVLHPRAFLTIINEATGGLSQVVALGPDDENDGGLAWFWQWSGAERTDPPEYERIAPVAAIAEVVERTSRILAPAASQSAEREGDPCPMTP